MDCDQERLAKIEAGRKAQAERIGDFAQNRTFGDRLRDAEIMGDIERD